MRELHSGALNMIECHHGVPLDTECPKCMEVAICGADAPPELTDKETILMARIAELEGALREIVVESDHEGEPWHTVGRLKEIACAALRSDPSP
jgi:hypothetical protein